MDLDRRPRDRVREQRKAFSPSFLTIPYKRRQEICMLNNPDSTQSLRSNHHFVFLCSLSMSRRHNHLSFLATISLTRNLPSLPPPLVLFALLYLFDQENLSRPLYFLLQPLPFFLAACFPSQFLMSPLILHFPHPAILVAFPFSTPPLPLILPHFRVCQERKMFC